MTKTFDAATAPLSRRRLLRGLLATGGVTLVTAGVAGLPRFRPAAAADGAFRFPQGLASADPTPDGVILWTRVEAATGASPAGSIPLTLQVAETPDFATVVVEKTVEALPTFDHTVRAAVDGLQPDRVYHYRFLAPDGSRPEFAGRTRTAPTADSGRTARFAFVSCQSYEDGYYGAYRTLINRDRAGEAIDFVLHLGDQIYETVGYGRVRNAGPLPSGGRPIRETTEGKGPVQADSLADYRHIYRTFLSDPDYRQARALFPFVSIWDDHEFSNDSWQSVTTYTPEGRSAARLKVASNQAWFEYIPARLAADFRPVQVSDGSAAADTADPDNAAAIGSLTIWRSLRWGRHLDLVLTDTRSYRSDHAVPDTLALAVANTQTYFLPQPLVRLLDAGRAANDGNPPAELTLGERRVPNPRKDAEPGTLLGAEQKAWVKRTLKDSTATWKIWANSVPLMPLRLDLQKVDPKGVETVLTADSWDGYQHERNELAGFLKAEGIVNVVSLSGDHHQHFGGLVHDDHDAPAPAPVAVEFSVTGVSSTPVFLAAAHYMKPDNPLYPLVTFDGALIGRAAGSKVENLNLSFLGGTRAAATMARTGDRVLADQARDAAHNPHLRYCDTNANGFGLVTASAEGLRVDLVTTARPVTDFGASGAPVLRTARFDVAPWDRGTGPTLPPPVVEGEKPFPLG